eukprot:GFUD01066767.1.p1 GENE.GFUD01066767.1~~GFUD01066767.1.p1  ORF type:complete len:153 (-),score=27.67 GFUD01066767.1:101-559(-)
MLVIKYFISILIGCGGLAAAGKSYHCSVSKGWITTVQGPVTYDTVPLSSGPGCISSSTGEYSAPNDGIYTLTYSLQANNNEGENGVAVWMRRNQRQLIGTAHYSIYTGPSGYVDDQGGRTMLVQLTAGDKVDVYCQDCSAAIIDVSFCISEM